MAKDNCPRRRIYGFQLQGTQKERHMQNQWSFAWMPHLACILQEYPATGFLNRARLQLPPPYRTKGRFRSHLQHSPQHIHRPNHQERKTLSQRNSHKMGRRSMGKLLVHVPGCGPILHFLQKSLNEKHYWTPQIHGNELSARMPQKMPLRPDLQTTLL